MSDKHGVVDVTPQYISGVTGLAVDEVIACMKRFCEPDRYSRSGAESGARLVLVDDHRDWGWRIVNHGIYREKARKQMQQIQSTESGRDADRKRIERERKSSGVPSRPAMSSADRPSDADADADADADKNAPTEKTPTERKSAPKRAARRCPEEFTPDLDFARSQISDVDAAGEAQRFKDYEFRTPRVDWPAAWRNWIRTCKESLRYAKAPPADTPMFNGKPLVWK